MYIMIYFIALVTGAQVFLLGLGVNIFFILIARILFVFKLFGMDIKLKWTIGLEISAVVMTMLWRVVWNKPFFDVDMLVLLVVSIIIASMQLYDSYFYVYTEEEEYMES